MSLDAFTQENDSWIDEDDLPTRAGLKVLKGFSPYDGMDEDEIVAYKDFMHWAINREHATLLSIPLSSESIFWPFEIDEFGCNVSAFSTVDFERLHPVTFSKYGYRLKKIFERVKALAILHSVISSEKGRANIASRYSQLIEKEFRQQLMDTVQRCRRETDESRKLELKSKVAKLSGHILECKKIWEQFAPWDI